MIEALIVFLIILAFAAAAYWVAGALGLPHPIPVIVAVIIVLIGLLYLVGSVDSSGVGSNDVD